MSRYSTKIFKRWIEGLHLGSRGPLSFPWLTLVYGEGPTVELACYRLVDDSIPEKRVAIAAKSVARVRVPRELACFAGGRLDLAQ